MMNYWSIYKTEFLTPEHEMVQRFPLAVSHDGTNTIFVSAPSDLTDSFVIPADLTGAALISTVGGFLVTQTTQPLVATKEQLEQLYRTPEHNLWCGPIRYDGEDDPAFINDKSAVGLDRALTRQQAKDAVKQLVSGV